MKSPIHKAIGELAPKFLAGFDSATGMVKALSNFLKGQDFEGAGVAPPIEGLAKGVNSLSQKLKEKIYIKSGGLEAIAPEELADVEVEAFTDWVTNSYPEQKYQAVMIGSSGGAAVHLGALLGIPWLPQTFFIPVQRHNDFTVDEPKKALEWAIKPAELLLKNNPQLQLHHMFDPSQDRLMLQRMSYFRLKKQRLGDDYERFLSKNLEKGGTIIINECQRTWPTVKVDDRYIFQFGALGGASADEFYNGSERVKEFLKRYDSPYEKWDAPEPDGERPEAEWGFEDSLRDDIYSFAQKQGYKVLRMIHQEPEHLSPFVAELYRWWYQQRNIPANRLVVDSFLVEEPYWSMATASVPFWMKFNMKPSAEWVEEYLSRCDSYDEIYLMLFSHGVDAIGRADEERWMNILRKARKHGDLLGADLKEYPRDFATLVMYNKDFKRKIRSRYPIRFMGLDQFYDFIKEAEAQYRVSFKE